MGTGSSFASAVIAFAITAISMGYAPSLARDLLTGGSLGGLVVQTPNFDTGLLLGLGILAGAFVFAQKMSEGTNVRLSGFWGILKYVVSIYYTIVLLRMMGTVILPNYNITIQLAFMFLATLMFLAIGLNMLAFIVKIAAPKEFEKKTKTAK